MISIAGAHGQIARRLHPLLVAGGYRVRGLIRDPAQADALSVAGVEPVVCDLETTDDLAPAVGEADLVVFAAGAGPGSGSARKWTVDRDAAIKLIDAAKRNGVKRYIMISVMNARSPRGSEDFQAYLQAKAEADDALIGSGLDYVIVRPGRLTDASPTGRVAIGAALPKGEIPRADVAAVIAGIVDRPQLSGMAVDVTAGDQPIGDALDAVSERA